MFWSLCAGPRKSKEAAQSQLQDVVGYCVDTTSCRHRILLEHFGDKTNALGLNQTCVSCCDNCTNKATEKEKCPDKQSTFHQTGSEGRRCRAFAGFMKASIVTDSDIRSIKPTKNPISNAFQAAKHLRQNIVHNESKSLWKAKASKTCRLRGNNRWAALGLVSSWWPPAWFSIEKHKCMVQRWINVGQ